MAEQDIVRDKLKNDPDALVRIRLDDFSHIEGIDLIAYDGEIIMRVSHKAVVDALVRDGTLWPATRLTPERWYIFVQRLAARSAA